MFSRLFCRLKPSSFRPKRNYFTASSNQLPHFVHQLEKVKFVTVPGLRRFTPPLYVPVCPVCRFALPSQPAAVDHQHVAVDVVACG
jgi:hypothetical protein